MERRPLFLKCVFLGLLALSSPQFDLHAAEPITIPFKLQGNRMLVSARINDSEPLWFMVDTGSALTTLHPEVVDQLKLKRTGRVRIIGISGEERAPLYGGVTLKFGEASFTAPKIASLPSERETSRRRRDGVLGSGLFRQFVVEVDNQKKELKLHAPEGYAYSGSGEAIPLRFEEDTPIIQGAVVGKSAAEGEFEIDTGCDSGLCLAASFTEKHKLLDEAQVTESEKFGVGGSVDTLDGTVPVLRLGKMDFREPQTDFFVGGSPVDEPLAGHIGMGVLGEGKIIFDYSRKRMILER